MRALLAACALLFAQAALAQYPNAAAWNEDAATLGFQVDAFAKCRGRLAEKPRFSACIQLWEDAYRRWNRMSAYAAARRAREPGVEAINLAERAEALGEGLDEAAAFLQPEVRKLGRAKVQRLVGSEKGLAKYRKPLEAVLRAKEPLDARALWKEP